MSSTTLEANQLVIAGEVVQIAELRYTPAGIPLLSFTLQHISEKTEAGMQRRVECAVPVIAMGSIAEQHKHLKEGTKARAVGFLAKRSMKSTQLVLHITTLEII